MPGLIEGAHEGKGLGDRFLRHIERTRIVLHMVDVSGLERTDPYKDFLAIQQELSLYGDILDKKARVIALNKIDLPDSEKNITMVSEHIKEPVFPVSALTGEGVRPLLDHVFRIAYGHERRIV